MASRATPVVQGGMVQWQAVFPTFSQQEQFRLLQARSLSRPSRLSKRQDHQPATL